MLFKRLLRDCQQFYRYHSLRPTRAMSTTTTTTTSSPLANTYRQIQVFNYSTNFTEATKIVDKPLIDPGADEILVKNLYVGINATDLNITAGRYFKHDDPPYSLGIEALGQVVKVGNDVSDSYNVGQYLVVKCSKMRAYSEYLYVTKNDGLSVVPEPKPEYVALLGTSGLTAAIGLMESARLQPGETVLVTAAAGGVGHIVVQWALLNRCRVVGLTSTPEKQEFLNRLGCHRVINYKLENLDQVLKKEYPTGIDVIWETIGSPVFEQLFEHLARKGRLINVGATAGYKTVGYAPINIDDFIVKLHYGARTVVGFLVMDYKDKYPIYSKQLSDYYRDNRLTIKVDFGVGSVVGHGLEAIADGIQYLHSGANLGKVIVKL
ncbi:prostaglandin reductase-3-like [Oppia nitens]|uniref:prostaglandin reductase-3-like n=1 Tax=Oppia nitens TaxID=1686743 RepID=UPI0023DB7821|nr:prostaglandin reductase-3-like [Oppia nitens]